MHAARPQVDREIEGEDATGSGRDSRHIGRHARPVAGDQDVGSQGIAVFGDELSQARRAALLGSFQHQLEIEPEPSAAFVEHRF